MIRRSFLKFLGAAPVAAPVIVREATQMSLGNTSVALQTAAIYDFEENDKCDVEPVSSILNPEIEKGYLVKRLEEINQPAYYNYIKADRLDPDLASMRSFSLSTAFRIQLERNKARAKQEHLDSIRSDFFSNGLEKFFKLEDLFPVNKGTFETVKRVMKRNKNRSLNSVATHGNSEGRRY